MADSHSEPVTAVESFREIVGDLGGYEADFLYIASFVAAFQSALKLPEWTFVDLRSGLEAPYQHPVIRDILRRCFGLAGRPLIMGNEGGDSSRIDKAFAKLLSDRSMEAVFYFPEGIPDVTQGFSFLPLDTRTRLTRFLIQNVFDSPSSSLQASLSEPSPIVGADAEGHRYFLLKDSSLEVGCWREVGRNGVIELLATSTDVITNLAAKLRGACNPPDRSKTVCVYCRKKMSGTPTICKACEKGCCHFSCLPANELTGLPWCCSDDCRQLRLAISLQEFVDEVEPLQKAAMRKRRRLQTEIRSLQMSDGKADIDTGSRRTSRGRNTSGFDYSFRDYDRLMTEAIRKSERKTDAYSSEEDIPRATTANLSREERMALRERRHQEVPLIHTNSAPMQEEEAEEAVDQEQSSAEHGDENPYGNVEIDESHVDEGILGSEQDESDEHRDHLEQPPTLEIPPSAESEFIPHVGL